MPLFVSPVTFHMVYTRKKRQQNKSLLGQCSEPGTYFMIEQKNCRAQIGNKTNEVDESITLKSAVNSIQVNYSQMDMHTIGENVVNKERSEVDIVMTTVETRVE